MSRTEHTQQSPPSPIGKTADGQPREPTETEKQRTDEILSPTAAAAILRIESELKFLCSLQVRHPTAEEAQPISSDSLTLEPSFDLTLDETFSLETLLDSGNNQWLTDLPLETFDEFLTLNPDMTLKDFSNISMEQTNEYSIATSSSSSPFPYPQAATAHDDSTNSSTDSSVEENERDAINRRGLKKSGGPLRKLARFGNKQVIKYSDEYHDRRVKNNEAVKKSRMKAKEKHKTTESKMSQLAHENRSLNDRVDLLMKELQVLKSLYRELNQEIPAAAVKALERVNVR